MITKSDVNSDELYRLLHEKLMKNITTDKTIITRGSEL